MEDFLNDVVLNANLISDGIESVLSETDTPDIDAKGRYAALAGLAALAREIGAKAEAADIAMRAQLQAKNCDGAKSRSDEIISFPCRLQHVEQGSADEANLSCRVEYAEGNLIFHYGNGGSFTFDGAVTTTLLRVLAQFGERLERTFGDVANHIYQP